MLDALSMKEKFIRKKLYNVMTLKTIVYCDNSLFIKDVKEAYKFNVDALKIIKAFFSTKTTRKHKKLMKISLIKDELI